MESTKEKIDKILEIKNQIITKYSLYPIHIQWKNNKRGTAVYSKRMIILPNFLLNNQLFPKHYLYWYIIHEMCHFINADIYNCYGHQNSFRKIEKQVLLSYSMIPIYSRAYVKKLKDLTGNLLYSRKVQRHIKG